MTPNASHFLSGCSCCTVSPPSGLFPEFSKYYSQLWLCVQLWQSQSTVSSTHLTLSSLCSVASCPFHSPKFQWFATILAPMMSLFSTSWTGITYFIKTTWDIWSVSITTFPSYHMVRDDTFSHVSTLCSLHFPLGSAKPVTLMASE